MERGGSSNRHGKTYPRTSSPGFLILDGDNAAACPVNPQEAPEHEQRVVNEQDRYLPIANVIRIMRSILPPHAKIADDAKETVQECVTEYIGFITSEANERCQREKRKTITAEDVLWAMRRLGFESYVKPLTVYLNRYRQLESRRTSVRGEPFVKRTIDFLEEPAPLIQVQPPHLPAGYLMGNPHGIYDPPFPMPMAGGFYGDLGLPTGGHAGGGCGSSSAAGDGGGSDGFEPYSMFK